MPDGPQEQFRQMLVGTGQKCAKDSVKSAAGQTVIASAWEHSEALFALLGWLSHSLSLYGAQEDLLGNLV